MTIRIAAIGLVVCALALSDEFDAAFAADQPTLAISVYGTSQEGFKKDLYALFAADCGCRLVVDAGNSAGCRWAPVRISAGCVRCPISATRSRY
jgi:hypothetical protein